MNELPNEQVSEVVDDNLVPAAPPHILNTIRIVGNVEALPDGSAATLDYTEDGEPRVSFILKVPRTAKGTKVDVARVTLVGKKAETFYRVVVPGAAVMVDGAVASELHFEPRNKRKSWELSVTATDFRLMQGQIRETLNMVRLWGYVDEGLEGKGIELRADQSGNSIVELTVLVPMDREQTESLHLSVILWANLGEEVYRNLKVGDYLFLEGRFISRDVTNHRLQQRMQVYHVSGSLVKANRAVYRLNILPEK